MKTWNRFTIRSTQTENITFINCKNLFYSSFSLIPNQMDKVRYDTTDLKQPQGVTATDSFIHICRRGDFIHICQRGDWRSGSPKDDWRAIVFGQAWNAAGGWLCFSHYLYSTTRMCQTQRETSTFSFSLHILLRWAEYPTLNPSLNTYILHCCTSK